MAAKRRWDVQDHTMVREKAAMRRKYLPPQARVLDLFCGNGEMYARVYQERAEHYHGVDKRTIHNPAICTLADNVAYITRADLSGYNVFDLDDYGCPWRQLYLLLGKLKQAEVTVFMTDGLVLHQRVDGRVTKFASATERLRRDFNVPGMNRWYLPMFATMLLDAGKRYGWQTELATYFHNARRTVYYWCLKLSRGPRELTKGQRSAIMEEEGGAKWT